MTHPPGTDPRLEDRPDVRPVVAPPREGLPRWAIAAFFILAGAVLFGVLETRRQAASAPAPKSRSVDIDAAAQALPALDVPMQPVEVFVLASPEPKPTPSPTASAFVPPRRPQPPRYYPPPPTPAITAVPSRPAVQRGEGTALVYDITSDDAAPGASADSGAAGASAAATPAARARATVFRGRSTTVPQGALIPAVMETALDTNRPGLARALVTRDVRGFDGSRVLIPRGSRLIGQYLADVQPGQNRALITWTRLVRPDGVMIALGSPSADSLGRIGVRGKVNSHFFERFGSAVLQTALDVGANLALPDGGYIIGMPAAALGGGGLANAASPQPTLRVKQGAAISVFAARDLDFAGVAGVQ